MIIKNAKVFRESGTFEVGDIFISGEYLSDTPDSEDIFDASNCFAIPGLVDLHLHGCVEHDFSAADSGAIRKMARYQAQSGITTICPTTMTLPEPMLAEACRNISSHHDTKGASIAGIYLEGPFLSGKKAGAQNPAYIQKPDVSMVFRLQAEAKGLIKLVAIAPETNGAMEFISELDGKVSCSLGHTTATYEIAQKALLSGAKQVTHLYNAMPPFLHRDPGLIGAAADFPDCYVELICDLVHVHPSVVRATIRMFGDDRVVFISDSIMATGLADGTYELGGLAVEVHGRVSTLAGSDTIAGSVTNLMECLKIAVKKMNIPLSSAVKCTSVNPAKALGIFDKVGSIEPGKYADVVLLNEDLSTHAVFLRGTLVK